MRILLRSLLYTNITAFPGFAFISRFVRFSKETEKSPRYGLILDKYSKNSNSFSDIPANAASPGITWVSPYNSSILSAFSLWGLSVPGSPVTGGGSSTGSAGWISGTSSPGYKYSRCFGCG